MGHRQSKMGKGQNEGGFSEEQLQMYKDCFKPMDINKDGTLDKNDLRGAFDNVGVLMSESELDSLLGEVGGACTYENMVKMFQEKMAGDGNDPDDLIVQAFKAYDNDGKIDSKMFQHALMTWGDKMTKAEIDDIFGEFEIDEDYMIKTKEVVGLFVAVKEEEKKVEEAHPPVEEAPVEEEDEEEGCQVNSWLHDDLDPSYPCPPGQAPANPLKFFASNLSEPEPGLGKARTRKAFTFLVPCLVLYG